MLYEVFRDLQKVRTKNTDAVSELGHKQVQIEWNGIEAVVDEKVAPLILSLWKLGIYTYSSCQETFDKKIHLIFCDVESAINFLNIFGRKLPEEEMWEIKDSDQMDYIDRDWDYRVFKDFKNPKNVVLVHFPITELPEVMSKLVC